MEKKDFTITIFSENKTGILSRVVGIITRRHFNIESVSASPASIEGIHRITIVIKVTEEAIKKLIGQLDKQVDVLKAFYYEDKDIVYQEIALYKVPTEAFFNGDEVESLVRKHNARILSVESEYIVIEKTGHREETEALLVELRAVGIYEFVRSGRIAIIKPMERLNNYLKKVNQDILN